MRLGEGSTTVIVCGVRSASAVDSTRLNFPKRLSIFRRAAASSRP